jgi:hypothetical protein
MKVTSVTLEISPELSQKLWDYGNVNGGADKGCAAAHVMLHYYGSNKSDLTVTPAVIAAWCENWFDPASLRLILDEGGQGYVNYPDCFKDPVMKGFVVGIVELHKAFEILKTRRSF